MFLSSRYASPLAPPIYCSRSIRCCIKFYRPGGHSHSIQCIKLRKSRRGLLGKRMMMHHKNFLFAFSPFSSTCCTLPLGLWTLCTPSRSLRTMMSDTLSKFWAARIGAQRRGEREVSRIRPRLCSLETCLSSSF